MADIFDQIYAETPEVAQSGPLSLPEKILGYSRSYLAGPTLGFADNLEAAIASVLTNNTYSQEIDAIRAQQNRFKENTDYIDNAVELASGTVLNPLSTLRKAMQGVGLVSNVLSTPAIKTATNLATSAPGQAAINAYGSSDGDLEAAATGAVVGSGASALGSILGKTFGMAGREADRLKLSAYGIGNSAISQQLKKLKAADVGIQSASDVPILSTLKTAERLGLVDAGEDALANSAAVQTYKKGIGAQVGNLIDDADKVVAPSKNFKWDELGKYIKSLSGDARTQAENIALKELGAIEGQLGLGKLADFQSVKTGLKYTAQESPAVGKGVVNAIRSDLRQAIEDRVNDAAKSNLLPATKAGQIKSLNRKWGDFNELEDAFYSRGASDLKGNMIQDGFMSSATTGGAGSANIASAVTGNPVYSAIGMLGNAARVPESMKAISDVLSDPALSGTLTGVSKLLPEVSQGGNIGRIYGSSVAQEKSREAQEQADTQKIMDVFDQIYSEQTSPTIVQEQKGEEMKTQPSTAIAPSPISDPVVEQNPKLKRIAARLTKEGVNLDGLDALDIAQIRAESSGVVNIEGPQTRFGRAKGLMQLLDSTGKEWHKKLGLEGKYDPFNAEQNITIGRAYRKFLEDRYDGDVRLALAAYNWGLGNLDRALARTKTGSFEEVVSNLPAETRNYVAKIMGDITGMVKA